jgi:hypothetical protein
VAQKRKFSSPAALKRKIDEYFRSIRRTVTVTEMLPTGEYDKYGHALLAPSPCLNDKKEEIKRVEYLIAPRMTALRLALKVDAETWSRYASGEIGDDDEEKAEFAAVCAGAKAICEDWLRGEQLTRTKGLAGVMRELEVNYGDGREQKVIVESRAPMTLEDKVSILARLGIVSGEGDPETGGEDGAGENSPDEV